MNLFVIAAGGYVPELSVKDKELGDKIGKLTVDMGNTGFSDIINCDRHIGRDLILCYLIVINDLLTIGITVNGGEIKLYNCKGTMFRESYAKITSNLVMI